MKRILPLKNTIIYLLIFLLTPLICAFLFSISVILLKIVNVSPPPLSKYLLEIISCVAMLLFFTGILKVKKESSVISAMKIKRTKLVVLFFGLLIGLSSFFIITAVLNMIPIFSNSELNTNNNQTIDVQGSFELLMLFIAKTLAAPFLEEITFRGLIYSELKKILSIRIASIIVTVIFGGLHFISSPYTVIIAILLSLFCNYLVDNYNSIMPGFLIHAGLNAMITAAKLDLFDFRNYEILIIVTGFILFFISVFYIYIDIKRHNKGI